MLFIKLNIIAQNGKHQFGTKNLKPMVDNYIQFKHH